MTPEGTEKVNPARVWFAAGFLLLGALALLWSTFDMPNYYLTGKRFHFHRFLWCAGFSFLGFGVLAIRLRSLPQSPWPSYVTYYPPMLIAISALVYSICFLFSEARGGTFYPLSASACFIMAHLVDDFLRLVASLMGRKSP
jgi:hypothetical protein